MLEVVKYASISPLTALLAPDLVFRRARLCDPTANDEVGTAWLPSYTLLALEHNRFPILWKSCSAQLQADIKTGMRQRATRKALEWSFCSGSTAGEEW